MQVYLILVLGLCLHKAYALTHDNRRQCIFVNGLPKDLTGEGQLVPEVVSTDTDATVIVCLRDSEFCFATWDYGVNNTEIVTMKGCWKASENNRTQMCQKSCLAPKKKGSEKKPYFCCCDTDNCNMDVGVSDEEPESEESEYDNLDKRVGNKNLVLGLMILFGSLISGGMILLFGYRYWRQLLIKKKHLSDGEDGEDPDESLGEGKMMLLDGITSEGHCLLGEDSEGIVDGLQLVVLLARGKFASVYEGRIPSLSDEPYALKCFGKEQKEFFENERFVFNYLGKHCNHVNIIKYYGWQEFTVGPMTHLILVLDKICPGSLRDYLQSITLSTPAPENDTNEEADCPLKVQDVLKICHGIASGLSYLHGENRDEIVIAHRDLTSKNILLDSATLTPKITDFGLSLVTRGSKYYLGGREFKAEYSSLAEAGTLRYMAPELLEGAVNLKDCENALKQADVYAMALILWEVANCSMEVRLTQMPEVEGQVVNLLPITHSLPYEEIGKENLNIDALSRHVVQYRQRPHFRRWRDTQYTRQLRDTLIESWDPEPDARLTALCIVERIHDIRNIRVKNADVTNNKSGTTVSFQTNNPLQSPLESPSNGLFGPDGPIIIDSPWTGRNPCLQRNLLVNNTTTSTTSGNTGLSSEGMSTSGSLLNESVSNAGLLSHYDLAKNQANLNFYHNYVGGSSGGTSYTGSSVAGGNVTEVSNVSSSEGQATGARACPPSQTIGAGGNAVAAAAAHTLPPTIPFVQNLHNNV